LLLGIVAEQQGRNTKKVIGDLAIANASLQHAAGQCAPKGTTQAYGSIRELFPSVISVRFRALPHLLNQSRPTEHRQQHQQPQATGVEVVACEHFFL
jgi:hypothetical protein